MDPVSLGGPVVLSALLAGAISLAGGRWGAALALAPAWFAALVGARGVPPLPPVEAQHFFAWAGIPAALWGLWATRAGATRPAEHAVRAVAGAVLARAACAPLLAYAWGAGEGWAWTVGLGAALAGVWALTEAVAGKLEARAAGTALTLAAGGVAAGVALTGSLLYGQLGGALAAGTAAVAAVALWRPATSLRGLVPAWALLSWGLLWAGALYSELPYAAAALLALAPAAALPAKGWRGALAVGVPVAAALAVAFVLAGAGSSDPYAY